MTPILHKTMTFDGKRYTRRPETFTYKRDATWFADFRRKEMNELARIFLDRGSWCIYTRKA